MSAVLVMTLGFNSCLNKSEVLFEFVCCYGIGFERDLLLFCIVSCTALWSTVVVLICAL